MVVWELHSSCFVVYPIPDSVSLKAAATVEPISCAVHGVKLLDLTPYQKALVIGDGFMGQLFVQLQAYGVHQLISPGLLMKRAFNKEKFGVTNTYNTTRDSIPADYDVVIEAVGLPQTQNKPLKPLRRAHKC